MSIGPPPDIIDADFSTLTAKQLREAQETIWAWLSEAEASPSDDMPDDEVIDDARDALNEVIAERRSLHGDESAPRGG